MKKSLMILCALICAVLLFSGCSHNVINYSDGIGLDTTFRPDSGSFGINFRYGKIFSAVLRENSEVEMIGEGSGGAEVKATTVSTSGSVKAKIGPQITGYYVDALVAGASPPELEKYIKLQKESLAVGASPPELEKHIKLQKESQKNE